MWFEINRYGKDTIISRLIKTVENNKKINKFRKLSQRMYMEIPRAVYEGEGMTFNVNDL
jgi:hypothetical protein